MCPGNRQAGAAAANVSVRMARNVGYLVRHLRNVLDDVGTSAIGKGCARLDAETKRQIAVIEAPLQLHLGYEPKGPCRHPLSELEAPLLA